MNDRNKEKIRDYGDRLRDLIDEYKSMPREACSHIEKFLPGIYAILIHTAFAPISCAAMPSWDDIDDSARLILFTEVECLFEELPEGTFDETVKLVSRSDLQQILRVDVEVDPDRPEFGRQIVAYLSKQ